MALARRRATPGTQTLPRWRFRRADPLAGPENGLTDPDRRRTNPRPSQQRNELTGDTGMISRRSLFASVPPLASFIASRRSSAASQKVVRVATQKGGPILMAERRQHGLEALLNPLGFDVKWL